MRLVILGNAGSGKTTLARGLAADAGVALLNLDAIAFGATAVRRPLEEGAGLLAEFVAAHDDWIVEGCYADLAALALAHADELVWLDPGVATCLAHCRARPYEPDKFADAAEQDAHLEALLAWVATYDTRDDEFGAARHRAVFEGFAGRKVRHVTPGDYGRP